MAVPMSATPMEAPAAAVGILPEWIFRCVAWALAGTICGGLAFAFRADGWRRVALLYMFLAALVTTQFSVHIVVHDLGFKHSTFLCFLQFVALGSVIWPAFGRSSMHVREADGVTPMKIASMRFLRFYTVRVLPACLTMAVAVAANNASLGLLDPGLNSVLGNMTPALTGVLATFYGARLNRRAWCALGLTLVGGFCTLEGGMRAARAAVASADSATMRGFTLSFAAMFFRALKTVVQDRAVRRIETVDPPEVHDEEKNGQARECKVKVTNTGVAHPDNFDGVVLTPMQLLMWQTPGILAALFAITQVCDGGFLKPMDELQSCFMAVVLGRESAEGEGAEKPRMLAAALLANVVCAGILNIVGMSVIQQLGATAMQIVGKCNIFIVMSFSSAYFGEVVAATEVIGALIVLYAVHMFSTASAGHGAQSTSSASTTDGICLRVEEEASARRRRRDDYTQTPKATQFLEMQKF